MFFLDLQDSNWLWHDGPHWPILGKECIFTIRNDDHEIFITGITDEIRAISLKFLDHSDGGFEGRREDGKVRNRHTPGSCLCYFVFVFVFVFVFIEQTHSGLSQICLQVASMLSISCHVKFVQALYQNVTGHTPGPPVC